VNHKCFYLLLGTALAVLLPPGAHSAGDDPSPAPPSYEAATNLLLTLKTKFARDSHLAIFHVAFDQRGSQLVLTGDVDRAEAKAETARTLQQAGVQFEDQVTLLPSPKLGDHLWGIACLSVANGREAPEQKAELGTQVLMGHTVRLWNCVTNPWPWYYAESADGYHAWIEDGAIIPCTRAQLEAWTNSALLIVTVYEGLILEKPAADAQPVSDVVVGNLVKRVGVSGDWYQVQLPDGRSGFLPRTSAEDYPTWKQSRHATADAIEQRARSLVGRPYLWGANSPKGLDCSGFTKLVFFCNGIDLDRNAGEQVHQGHEVPLDPDFSRLRKGDLLFFGKPAAGSKPENIYHVGIYLGDKLFIQSSERVRINSLDLASPICDERRLRTLLHARRILP
jgi:cell wall-associated NlpC family hydrolase